MDVVEKCTQTKTVGEDESREELNGMVVRWSWDDGLRRNKAV